MTGGTGPGYTKVPLVCVYVHVRVCELAATILILFVQTDPVPFYFQLVENKLVLFLHSVAMTTQPFLVDLEKSRKSKASVLFFRIYDPSEYQYIFPFCKILVTYEKHFKDCS